MGMGGRRSTGGENRAFIRGGGEVVYGRGRGNPALVDLIWR